MISKQSKVLYRITYEGAQFSLSSFELISFNHISGPFSSYRFSGHISGYSRTFTYDQVSTAFAKLMDIMAVNTPFRYGNRLIVHKFVVTDMTLHGVNSHTSSQYVCGETLLQRIHFLDLIKSSRKLFARSADISEFRAVPKYYL